MKKLYLNNGQFALVDNEDFDYLNQFSWSLMGKGYVRRGVRIGNKNKTIALHREIMKHPEGKEIDHINHNKLDNQKSNLRICSHQENLRNQKIRIDNSTGFKGVCYRYNLSKTRPWQARIFFNGKDNHLGLFATKEEAVFTYSTFAIKYFKEYVKIT